MNWEAIGAVAELLGALGVIASLAYLGLQVRQNTRQMRLNAESLGMTHEMGGAQMSISIATQVMGDPDFAELLRRARDEDVELTAVERLRWGTYLWTSLLVFQAGYQNYRKGLADPDSWEGHARNLTPLLSSPGARVWWDRNRGRFADSFAKYVDGELDRLPQNAG